MTAAELYYGAEKSARPAANRSLVDEFLLTLPIIHTNLSILRLFGHLMADLERAGQPLPDADILITATCLARCDRLVTGNQAHFRHFPELRLDDWMR